MAYGMVKALLLKKSGAVGVVSAFWWGPGRCGGGQAVLDELRHSGNLGTAKMRSSVRFRRSTRIGSRSMGLIKSRSDDDGLPPAPEHHGPVHLVAELRTPESSGRGPPINSLREGS